MMKRTMCSVILICLLHAILSSAQPEPEVEYQEKGAFPEGEIIEVRSGPNSPDGIMYTPELRSTMREFRISEDDLRRMFERQQLTGEPTTLRDADGDMRKSVTLDFKHFGVAQKPIVREMVYSNPEYPNRKLVVEKGTEIVPGRQVEKKKIVRVGDTKVVTESRVGPTEIVDRKVYVGPELPGPGAHLNEAQALETKRIYEQNQAELRRYQEENYRRQLQRNQNMMMKAVEKRNKLGAATTRHVARISQEIMKKYQVLPGNKEQDYNYIKGLMADPANQGVGKYHMGPGSQMQRLPGIVIGMGPTMPKFPNRFQVNKLQVGPGFGSGLRQSPRVRPFWNPARVQGQGWYPYLRHSPYRYGPITPMGPYYGRIQGIRPGYIG